MMQAQRLQSVAAVGYHWRAVRGPICHRGQLHSRLCYGYGYNLVGSTAENCLFVVDLSGSAFLVCLHTMGTWQDACLTL